MRGPHGPRKLTYVIWKLCTAWIITVCAAIKVLRAGSARTPHIHMRVNDKVGAGNREDNFKDPSTGKIPSQ